MEENISYLLFQEFLSVINLLTQNKLKFFNFNI